MKGGMTLPAAKRAWAKQDRQIAQDVAQICAEKRITREVLAKRLGMSRRTLYEKTRNPKRFTMEELREIQLIKRSKKWQKV